MEISSILQLCGDFLGTLGSLKGVVYTIDKEFANAVTDIVFTFEDISLRISVNDEDDSICLFAEDSHVELSNNTDHNLYIDDVIASLLSKRVIWIWELTNQQGYRDGLQFEFFGEEPSSYIDVQFIAAASKLRVYILKKIA